MITINIVTFIATRLLKVRFIPSERNDPTVGRSFLLRVLQRVVYGKADTTVFQTERARNYFSNKIKEKSVIIANPVIVYSEASEEKAKKIVSVGRLEKQKNQQLLINAFAEIKECFPEYILEIYGEGSLKKELEQLTYDLGIQKSVFFMGNRKNVHELISDAEMFVLTSNFEGLSNALLEAMMMGLTCISTDCAGSDEIIINKYNGLIVSRNDKNQLVKAMIEVLSNERQSDYYAINAKLTSKKYKVSTIVDAWCTLIGGEV